MITPAPPTLTRPTALRTDGSNAFAHHSMKVRIPSIIQETVDRNSDYAKSVKTALKRLRNDIRENARLRFFDQTTPDFNQWAAAYAPHKEETWLGTEWLFSEMYAYRLMVEAGQYWITLRDPFAPFKHEELESHALWDTLAAVLDVSGSQEERLEAHFLYSLWGNRMDLSLKDTAAMGMNARDEHLLANDIPEVVQHLLGFGAGEVHMILDNAGTELAMDLALVDFLLRRGVAQQVVLHIKMQPVLVSDAIVADVHGLLDAMMARGGQTAKLAVRLWDYVAQQQLTIIPDFFWNTAGRLWKLPFRLKESMREARLVISKGDLNYRRATNDAIWKPEATLFDAIQGFPTSLMVLRTLKSDTLVGIDAETQAGLDAHGEKNWRTSGAYGVAQFAP